MPRLTKGPLPFSPHACLVTGSENGELIDFERDFIGIDPRVYLRREVVEEAARETCNMVSADEVQEVRRQLAEFGKKLDETLADLDLTKDFESKFSQSLEAGVTVGVRLETPAPGTPEADAIEIETASTSGPSAPSVLSEPQSDISDTRSDPQRSGP